MMKVCLLGASGSIGQQTIDVMLKNKDRFDLVAFSVGFQVGKIPQIVRKFNNIKYICVRELDKVEGLKIKFPHISFLSGDEGLNEIIKLSNCDMVVNALVGFAGLSPTICSLENNKILCLANKESLVVGGPLVKKLLKEGHGKLYPIDSEHVAIAKCLSVSNKNVKKVIITASGGAFRNLSRSELKNVTAEDALKHPTWNMGKKITIDSASMVNKTFEIIEAHYLFDLSLKDIGVIINYNSFVHSLVLYKDGCYRLDCGNPDMRVPIKYALFEGVLDYKTYIYNDLNKVKNTKFDVFDMKRYPVVKHAKTVIKEEGTYGTVLNASNEAAVYAFLEHKIKFLDIEKIINYFMKNHKNIKNPTFEQIKKIDSDVRKKVNEMIEMKGKKLWKY